MDLIQAAPSVKQFGQLSKLDLESGGIVPLDCDGTGQVFGKGTEVRACPRKATRSESKNQMITQSTKTLCRSVVYLSSIGFLMATSGEH